MTAFAVMSDSSGTDLEFNDHQVPDFSSLEPEMSAQVGIANFSTVQLMVYTA